MTIEQRTSYLKELAKTEQGLAVIEFLEEKITQLKDASKFPLKNFEVNGKASLKAAVKLEEVIATIKRLGNPEPEKGKNQYV
jgi:hypothetical protein